MKKTIFFLMICTHFISYSQLAGTPDVTYGMNGRLNHDFGNYYYSPALSVEQTDGKILVSAYTNIEPDKFLIMRFLENGAIDTNYGNNGKATYFIPNITNKSIHKMILQPDGKLLVNISGTLNMSIRSSLIRFNTDGSLDNSFGLNGDYNINISTNYLARDFVLQNDNKIVISYQNGGSPLNFLIRLNNNGVLDLTFGTNGYFYPLVNGNNVFIKQILLQSDEKYLLNVEDAFSNRYIARFNSDNSIDTTYGANGFLIYNNVYDIELIIQQDNKLVYQDFIGNNPIKIRRLNVNGTYDTTLGWQGNLIYNLPNGFFVSSAKLAIQSDNRIIVFGTSNIDNQGYLSMLRFNPIGGAIDTTFGTSGQVLWNYDNSGQVGDYQTSLVLNSGKILCMGYYQDGNTLPNGFPHSITVFNRFNSGVQLSNEKFEVNKTVGVSPNPSNGIFNLNLNNDLNNFKEIEVYDLLGKLILNQNIENKTQVGIDLSKYESGYYLAKLQNEKYSTVVKLLKN